MTKITIDNTELDIVHFFDGSIQVCFPDNTEIESGMIEQIMDTLPDGYTWLNPVKVESDCGYYYFVIIIKE